MVFPSLDQPAALSEKDESEASPIIDVYGMHLVSMHFISELVGLITGSFDDFENFRVICLSIVLKCSTFQSLFCLFLLIC